VFILQHIVNIISSNIFFTGYVTGNTTFPKPLNEKEEAFYLNEFKEGSVEAKGILIERNLRLVAHIVKKYSFPNKEVDDLISIGTVGLIKAIESFNTGKGTRLATYAARCIENEILMLFRNTKKTKGEVYLQDPIGVDKEGNEEKEILEMRYGLIDGDVKTQREIALILGISRSYVSRIEKKALKKLFKEFNSQK
jgi:RNA polymerase sporulation-specific sigma factor